MSHDLQTDDTVATAATVTGVDGLRKLYYLRFAFAVGWAAAFAVTSSALTPVSVTLLVLYPLVDVCAAVVDFRSSGATRPRRLLVVTMALSLLAAVALAIAAASGMADVLRVWGAWAIAAGAVQLVVAIRRHRLGGQRAMILSGGISVLAGASFVGMAAGSDASLASLAAYATLGGIFFLVSAIRLGRVAETRNP